MLHFLRRVRRSLVKKGKTRSYLIYAVGEILLVVVGILIALQVNNWNTTNQNKQLIERVLKTLEDETRTNLEQVERSLIYRSSLVNNLRNNKHLIEVAALADLTFDPRNDQEMIDHTRKVMIQNLQQPPKQMKIVRQGEQRFFFTGNVVSRFVVENDTLKVYGHDNIRLRTARISSDAWKLTETTNAAVHMDYELILELSKTNTLFEAYQASAKKALDILYTGDGYILSVLEDMVYYEKELRKKYEKILEFIAH